MSLSKITLGDQELSMHRLEMSDGAAPKDYGYFGPNYATVDDIKLPGELGVRQESSFQAIFDSIGGINYYLDTIAFGSATGFDNGNPQPLGIRYYLDTGLKCSNGATMNEYVDGVTKGDLLGERVANGLASAGLPGMRGLAPGMLENARDALDPRPLFSAVTGTGYPVCQEVACPVGTIQGKIAMSDTPNKPFILGQTISINNLPYQKRWVQSYTENGSAISISKDEYTATAKCYNPDGSYMARPPDGCPPTEPAASGGRPSGSKYKNCLMIRAATLPPTLAAGREGFTDFISEDPINPTHIFLLAGLVGLIALLASKR
jgi:hypothetical protein